MKIYFEEKTEREIADAEGVYRNAIHKRKQRILEKLKKIFKKFGNLGCAKASPNV